MENIDPSVVGPEVDLISDLLWMKYDKGEQVVYVESDCFYTMLKSSSMSLGWGVSEWVCLNCGEVILTEPMTETPEQCPGCEGLFYEKVI
jgi:rubrerythrin